MQSGPVAAAAGTVDLPETFLAAIRTMISVLMAGLSIDKSGH
jgi:hypothetical protein